MTVLRKGIILAGGEGSRLRPLTEAVSKQLLPIYDKPMIYYALSTLMLAGVREILIITTGKDQAAYQSLLRDGSQWGLKFSFVIQETPRGLADAFILGEQFLDGGPGVLILGDNIYYGHGWSALLRKASETTGFSIFVTQVSDPTQFGVIELDKNQRPVNVVEKPEFPKSNLAITGLYFFDNDAVSVAKNVLPSARNELEITSVIEQFIEKGQLSINLLSRGFAWLDAGTHHGLQQAGNFVQTLQDRQGFLIASPEEIALRQKFIDVEQFKKTLLSVENSEYGAALKNLLTSGDFSQEID